MKKPLPLATPTSTPFWEGLREGEIRLQRCRACASWIFYPRSNCPTCLSSELDWQAVEGTGHLHTFTISRTPTAAFFADEVPQFIAVIELDEGVRMTSTLVETPEEAIEIGMPVEPVLEPTDGGEGVLLRFRRAE